MVVGTLDLKTVTLSPDMLLLEQNKDMTLFEITHHELFYTNASSPDQGLRMLIVMKRKIMSEIMTTFFPSILLTLITFATTFFKHIFFEASLSVNLTTMLVMTTIFISKMEGLPPTSDIKMIDYWLILCQLVPFAQVVILTATEFLRKETVEENHVLEKEGFQEAEPTNYSIESSIQSKVEDEANPKEAWTMTPMEVERTRTSFVPMLPVIGIFFVEIHCLYIFSFREESDAPDCAMCIPNLLWNCCMFLLVRISSIFWCLQTLQK